MADASAPTPDADQQPVIDQPNGEGSSSTAAADASAVEPDNAPGEAETAASEAASLDQVEAVEAVEPVTDAVAPAAAVAAPRPEAAPVSPPAVLDVPSLASTVEVPASADAPAGEGGEWELLLEKLRHWLGSGQLQEQWQAVRTPLSLLTALIGLLLVLRVYGAVMAVIDGIPLLPGLLELAGLIAVVQFSLTRLVRSEDRREVIQGLKQRWLSFRGGRS